MQRHCIVRGNGVFGMSQQIYRISAHSSMQLWKLPAFSYASSTAEVKTSSSEDRFTW